MINRIRYEGFRNSKIMEIASGLMDGIGPRLTGSPSVKQANEWTRDQLTSFGLTNAHLESWGPFGRGWSNEFVSVRMVSPPSLRSLPMRRPGRPAPTACSRANASASKSKTRKTSTSIAASWPA